MTMYNLCISRSPSAMTLMFYKIVKFLEGCKGKMLKIKVHYCKEEYSKDAYSVISLDLLMINEALMLSDLQYLHLTEHS